MGYGNWEFKTNTDKVWQCLFEWAIEKSTTRFLQVVGVSQTEILLVVSINYSLDKL